MEKVKVVNKSGNPLPSYATLMSAGMDLYAHVDGTITVPAHSRKLIPTGLYIELPSGYEAQIRPRSGLALKEGITVLNTPGTIDADYRGNVGVILFNSTDVDFVVPNKFKIAQMVISKYEQIEWEEVAELSDTERGTGGFGHSGN